MQTMQVSENMQKESSRLTEVKGSSSSDIMTSRAAHMRTVPIKPKLQQKGMT